MPRNHFSGIRIQTAGELWHTLPVSSPFKRQVAIRSELSRGKIPRYQREIMSRINDDNKLERGVKQCSQQLRILVNQE